MAAVLVVDDEPDIRELVRINLEMDGHEVALASDGPSALAYLDGNHADVVVLDVMMPGMDGWEVLSRIKAAPKPEVATTPVLMLTAKTDELDKVRGGIEGAIRYITKPFTMEELRTQVAYALEGDPEPVKRRTEQRAALERLARLEKGEGTDTTPQARPHITRFEAATEAPARRQRARSIDVSGLSPKQQELLARVANTRTVREAADQLDVSRSNVYASLRRIARKLDVHSVPELVMLARSGSFDFP